MPLTDNDTKPKIKLNIKEARTEALKYLKKKWREQFDVSRNGDTSHLVSKPPSKGPNTSDTFTLSDILDKVSKKTELIEVSVMKSPMFGTEVYRFQQKYNNTHIYKSSVIVSLDEHEGKRKFDVTCSKADYLDFPGLFSSEDQTEIKEQPEDIIKEALIKHDKNIKHILDYLKLHPIRYHYHDDEEKTWRLVYVTDSELNIDKLQNISKDELKSLRKDLPAFTDCIVDARTKELISTFVQRQVKSSS